MFCSAMDRPGLWQRKSRLRSGGEWGPSTVTAAFWNRARSWLAVVGLAMVPRGEVGLVFASTASALGVFDQTLYSVVTLVVMATTFLTPPVLARIARR